MYEKKNPFGRFILKHSRYSPIFHQLMKEKGIIIDNGVAGQHIILMMTSHYHLLVRVNYVDEWIRDPKDILIYILWLFERSKTKG